MPGARPLALLWPLALVALGALESPPPWNAVWLVVPLVGGAGFLANRAFGQWGWIAPSLTAGWLLASGSTATPHGWAALGAVASASLLGWSAEATGESRGHRLWSFLPLLVLASIFPLTGIYQESVRQATAAVERGAEEAFQRYRDLGVTGAALEAVAVQVEQGTSLLRGAVERFLPAILFAWSSALVGVTVLLVRRICEALGRPLSPRQPFSAFAMPEEAVWLLVLALTAVAARAEPLAAVGINAAACLGSGYALQGLAIGRSALAARGWRGGMFWVLVVFVFLFAPPLLAAGATILGLADVWLDLRRRFREPTVPGREA